MELTGKQKRTLRAKGNTLKPLLKIGKEGISDNTISALCELFEKRELIKVEITRNCPVTTADAAKVLEQKCDAQLVSIIGRKLLLFKINQDEPK
ncbi:ribosome assembly RNA-binding protein YhbY [Candidatus Calescamantes bacterium]|nr:ribosome assembly RNA-binding protein YhbY [Candidatus Calescamantes bacterium]MCK5598795.1 ribosome assembly RNA-binding protein YhbY [bacterium]